MGWWFGFLEGSVLLAGSPRIPNHRAPNHQLGGRSIQSDPVSGVGRRCGWAWYLGCTAHSAEWGWEVLTTTTNGKSDEREILVRFFMPSSCYLQELATLYEKIKIQQSTLQKGEIQCPRALCLNIAESETPLLSAPFRPADATQFHCFVPMRFAVPTWKVPRKIEGSSQTPIRDPVLQGCEAWGAMWPESCWTTVDCLMCCLPGRSVTSETAGAWVFLCHFQFGDDFAYLHESSIHLQLRLITGWRWQMWRPSSKRYTFWTRPCCERISSC